MIESRPATGWPRPCRPTRDASPLILAIPRGAVPMGRALAGDLQGELDVVMVRKIGRAVQPGICAGCRGRRGMGVPQPMGRCSDPATLGYIESESKVQLDVLRPPSRPLYARPRTGQSGRGASSSWVDDGLATGSTMIAALHSLRGRHPARLICAVPVAPPDVVEKIGALRRRGGGACTRRKNFRRSGRFIAISIRWRMIRSSPCWGPARVGGRPCQGMRPPVDAVVSRGSRAHVAGARAPHRVRASVQPLAVPLAECGVR
jgi:putative phosphoribosyl transferase